MSFLAATGIEHVFLVPGAQIDPLCRALGRNHAPTPMVACHELAAGYMADGYARAKAAPGVVFSIGGPGAANLAGAAVSADADRSPVLFVSGDVPTPALSGGVFQCGSRDRDIFRAALGHSFVADSSEALPELFSRLWDVLASCRPVHLAFPLDSQLQNEAAPFFPSPMPSPPMPADKVWDALEKDFPLLLVCGSYARVDDMALRRLAERLCLPVATVGGARGVVPEDSRWSVGHVGFMPDPRAIAALAGRGDQAAQVVVALGCPGDDLPRRYGIGEERLAVVEDDAVAAFLDRSPQLPEAGVAAAREAWLDRLHGLAPSAPEAHFGGEEVSLTALVDALVEALPEDTVFALDAGQIRRVAAARLRCRRPRSLLMAEGMAPMGWGLCAALGAKVALPERPVVALVGDGSMRMHGLELATAVRYNLGVLFVVCDNRGYGSLLGRDSSSTTAALARLPAVDWCGFARSMGVAAVRVGDVGALASAVSCLGTLDRPYLLEVSVPEVDIHAYARDSGIAWVEGLYPKDKP